MPINENKLEEVCAASISYIIYAARFKKILHIQDDRYVAYDGLFGK